MSVSIATPAPNPFSPEALAAKALEKLGASPPTADTILRLAAHLAELVNKAPDLRGPEKAALVQQVLRDIVNMPDARAKMSDEITASLNTVIDTVVPTVLTLIISAGRGEFDLSSPQKAAASIWSWCCRSAAAVAVASRPMTAGTETTAKVLAEMTALAEAKEVEVELRPAAPEAAPAASSAPTESSAPAVAGAVPA